MLKSKKNSGLLQPILKLDCFIVAGTLYTLNGLMLCLWSRTIRWLYLVTEKQNKKTRLQLAGFSQVQIQTLGSGKRIFLNFVGSYTLSDQITLSFIMQAYFFNSLQMKGEHVFPLCEP